MNTASPAPALPTKEVYDTGQQIAFGLIALLAGIAAVMLETVQPLDLSPAKPE